MRNLQPGLSYNLQFSIRIVRNPEYIALRNLTVAIRILPQSGSRHPQSAQSAQYAAIRRNPQLAVRIPPQPPNHHPDGAAIRNPLQSQFAEESGWRLSNCGL
eukprot:4201975-Alexandrium_andersonii.AAC.1